jgi:hypothetical protein
LTVENENNGDNDWMMFVTEMCGEYVDVERKDRADAAAVAVVVADEGELAVDIDEDYVVVVVDDDDDDEQTIEYVVVAVVVVVVAVVAVVVDNEMSLYVDVGIN